MISHSRSYIFAAIFTLLCSVIGSLAADIFLYLPKVPGESLDSQHKQWIEAYSFSHGISGPVKSSLGTTPPVHYGVTLMKPLDLSSPRLDLLCNNGTVLPNAVLEFTRTIKDTVRYYHIQLTNVTVVSIQDSGSGGDVSESVELHYQGIFWSYTEYDASGTPLPDVVAWWSIPYNTGGATPPAYVPYMIVGRQPGGFSIAWPVTATGYTLQGATSLSSPDWAPIPGVENNQVTIPIDKGQWFYRLQKQ